MTTTQTCSVAQSATLSTTVDELINFVSIQVVTLGSLDAGDSFNLNYPGGAGNSDLAVVVGTNCTSAAMQTWFRTATGDASATVSGTTDAGPFTFTFVASLGARPTIGVSQLVGCTLTSITNSLEQPHYSLAVWNRDSSVTLYFNVNSATVPTSAADDTYPVLPGTSVSLRAHGEVIKCRVVGNGNAYSVGTF